MNSRTQPTPDKNCEYCGKSFMRGHMGKNRMLEPYKKFMARRFCSKTCADDNRRQKPTCGHDDERVVGHGKCKRCYSRWLRAQHGDAGKAKRRGDRILAIYGITPVEFASLREAQNDRCALCCREFGPDSSVHVDHCHETNRVRGLLCFSCNKALGILGDNEVGIQRALAYIKGAPILMRKLDDKAAAKCGLPPGSGSPKAFIEFAGSLQQRSAETVGIFIPDPDPFWREHRSVA